MISRPRCAPNCWIFLVGITMGTNTSWHNNSQPIPMLIVWRQAPWQAIRMGALAPWKLKLWSLGGVCFVNRQKQEFSEARVSLQSIDHYIKHHSCWYCGNVQLKKHEATRYHPKGLICFRVWLLACAPTWLNGSRLLGRKCKPCNHEYWSFTKNCPWLPAS